MQANTHAHIHTTFTKRILDIPMCAAACRRRCRTDLLCTTTCCSHMRYSQTRYMCTYAFFRWTGGVHNKLQNACTHTHTRMDLNTMRANRCVAVFFFSIQTIDRTSVEWHGSYRLVKPGIRERKYHFTNTDLFRTRKLSIATASGARGHFGL